MHIVTIARNMRSALLAATIAAVVSVSPAGFAVIAPAQAASTIKVVVNDQAITTMDVQARGRLLQLAMHLPAGAAAKAAQDELIDEQLRLQEGARRGVVVSEDAVVAALTSIASRSKMTLPQFERALGSGGVPIKTFKDRIRAQMVWGRIVRAKIQQDIKTESADLIQQMRNREKNADAITANDYMLQRVVFAVQRSASPAEVNRRKAEAEALRGKFRSCSEGLALAKGLREVAVVNVGRKLASEVPPALKDELEKTAEGRLTSPERSDLGFEMYAICSKIAVTGEAAVAAGLDAEALDKRGEETSKKLTQELRQKANIIYR
ncbi:Chaperone SurA [Pleomorphomonas sp. T1.2MG-36]|uniref:SurA N-terminal domain-containing protein n=1 Tax=Pleomorphomonas sp. T1.2MG-36 TaxID=3041167 RepID=UPI002477AC9C|nr:SurA N-terminal domain-containing protein [Pleomorphomonas sp. T1.2MG-36]CAI9406046.1 Chaperone SurA [Pleomorphomonas sp. T1.2MG-36]